MVIELKDGMRVINTGCGYQIWKGSAFCGQWLDGKQFKTTGEAVAYAIDKGYAKIDYSQTGAIA